MKRTDWVRNRCGMAVLCISMTYWTMETEIAFGEGGVNGIKKYSEKCTNQVIIKNNKSM